MKIKFLLSVFTAIIIFVSFTLALHAQELPTIMSKSNRTCISCHGNKYYSFYNAVAERNEHKLMNPYFVIDSTHFLAGVHKTFACTDCHSPDYGKYPHIAELKLETQYTCLDCHGGDENFARFQFEEIDTEFQNSVHFQKLGDNFKCEKCHDPHTYKLVVRDEKSKIKDILLNNNEVCLSCHDDNTQYQVLTASEHPQLLKTHEWLPNQAVHFKNVRCIECHSKLNDSILVSHEIMPKEKAVRLCNECHSQNSILMATLYKFKSKEQRKDGFFNGVILNQSYVIGANRNEYLNYLSLLIFIMTFGIIGVHTFFRIVKNKKNK